MALWLTGCLTPLPAAERPPQAILERSVVHIAPIPGSVCSGVFVEEGLLTAAHCIYPRLGPATVTTRDNQVRQVVALRVDRELDLALLKLRSRSRSRPVGLGDAEGGAAVRCAGHPLGDPWVVHRGHIASSSRPGGLSGHGMYQLVDAGVVPGMSGGACFDDQGRVVGIMSFNRGRGHGGGLPVLGGIVPASVIRAFLGRR